MTTRWKSTTSPTATPPIDRNVEKREEEDDCTDDDDEEEGEEVHAAIEALKERNEDEKEVEEEENEEEEYEDGLLLPSIWRKKFCLPTKDWTDAILGKRL